MPERFRHAIAGAIPAAVIVAGTLLLIGARANPYIGLSLFLGGIVLAATTVVALKGYR